MGSWLYFFALKCKFSVNLIKKSFTKRHWIEGKVLALLRQKAAHSAKSLSLELGVSERQIQRILRKLKEEGTIEHNGAKRNGKWIVY